MHLTHATYTPFSALGHARNTPFAVRCVDSTLFELLYRSSVPRQPKQTFSIHIGAMRLFQKPRRQAIPDAWAKSTTLSPVVRYTKNARFRTSYRAFLYTTRQKEPSKDFVPQPYATRASRASPTAVTVPHRTVLHHTISGSVCDRLRHIHRFLDRSQEQDGHKQGRHR